ncbi:MAG: NAD(P)/FAD-dependent oxidoreductase [Planctomycetota bacterium]|nr:NAD(P)/FAD-dependent oxidoreductase [Planctomycetota bacterium]
MQGARCDIAVVGAGAAGLFAGLWAARTLAGEGGTLGPGRVVLLDGARTLGAKILVAGGGRCNVTHHEVDERAYAGSSPHAVRRVLAAFPVSRTVDFFRELGVELKREPTGKLFPVTDAARTVLDALLRACRDAGAEIRHPWRVGRIDWVEPATGNMSDEPASGDTNNMSGGALGGPGHFRIHRAGDGPPEWLDASRVILATGGMALPRSGSDGAGYQFARALGHTTTRRIFPALVPLTTPDGHWTRSLSGITTPATIELRSPTGKRLRSFTNSTLLTHVGLSGPSVLDMSRYYTDAQPTHAQPAPAHAHAAPAHAAHPSPAADSQAASLVINWLPGVTPEALDQDLARAKGPGIARYLAERVAHTLTVPEHEPRGMPLRLAQALCEQAGVDPQTPVHTLTREHRRGIVRWSTQCPIPVTGDRGFTHAEVTAGGVPLAELDLATMQSRVRPGLHLCGEILDVDGRIGGFNFQWAWASGYAAGVGAGAEVRGSTETGR